MNRKYMLAIKRDDNDYLPLEWNMLKNYQGEDLSSLEGIDNFTSRMQLFELVDYIVEENLVDADSKYESFVILYNEKGKNRIVKEGVLFADNKDAVDEEIFVSYLMSNITDKKTMNRIDNILNNIEPIKEVREYILILKNWQFFLQHGEKALKIALMKIKEIPYEQKRKILINVYEKMIKVPEEVVVYNKEKAA